MTETTSSPTATTGAVPVERSTAREHADWWREAVIYQIYPRSFADGNGDGMGDLPGITARLEHVAALGADAVWLSPFYTSPQHDAGYDVADYRDVDPRFGSLADAEEMIHRAHDLGLRVIVDLVPNHTSEDHEWFRAALNAGPGSPERERYWFRDGKTDPATGEVDPDTAPADWRSVFGGAAWSRVRDRVDAQGSPWQDDPQWYLHLFDRSQPDLNWEHPEVVAEFHSILRFWLDRGVDGFRVDVAHGLVKDPSLPDDATEVRMVSGAEGDAAQRSQGAADGRVQEPMWDQDGVHEIYRGWRSVLEEYSHSPILVAEAWVEPPSRLAKYVRSDEMHQAFNFIFLSATWTTAAKRTAIAETMDANDAVGAPTTWVLSNHDVVRHATRLGLADEHTGKGPNGLFASDPQPDAELGLRRARAATMLMLGLPGSAYLYQGEELGLPEHTALPDEVREDPAYERMNHEEAGRDGCRVPLPWDADAPGYGFGPAGEPWLPQPDAYAKHAVSSQEEDLSSTLNLYRRVLNARREHHLGRGSWQWTQDDALVGVNTGAEGTEVLVMTAIERPLDIPEGWRVLIASEEFEGAQLPEDTTAWLVRR